MALGERPDYLLIVRYVNNIADLYIRYAGKVIRERMPELEQAIANNQNVISEEDVPRTMQNQPDAVRIWSIEMALSSEEGKKNLRSDPSTGFAVRSAMTVPIFDKNRGVPAAAAGKTHHGQDRRAAGTGLSGHERCATDF